MNVLQIEDDILKGWQCDHHRLQEAASNLDYFNLEFKKYQNYVSIMRGDEGLAYRSSAIMHRTIKTLTSLLYAKSPVRTFVGLPEATSFLERVYKGNAGFAIWQALDYLSMVAQCSAVQVAGGPDPRCPVKLSVWSADKFVVFPS